MGLRWYAHLWRHSSSNEGMYLHPLHPPRICDAHGGESFEGGGGDNHFSTSLGVKPPMKERWETRHVTLSCSHNCINADK